MPKIWRPSRTTIQMAMHLQKNKMFADLPILADKLEDDGCTDMELLEHFRGIGSTHEQFCPFLDGMIAKCKPGQIDLGKPARREKVRGFQPPWRTVFVYVCPVCDNEVRIGANSFRGKTAVPGVGAVACHHCVRELQSEGIQDGEVQ